MTLAPARLEDVTVQDPYLRNAADRTLGYVLSLDPERLLFSFYRLAGLPPTTAEGYGGWEREEGTRFQGHFFGHVISALAQAYASSEDVETRDEILDRLGAAVLGLDRCQQAYAAAHPDAVGYVSPFPPELLPSGGDGLLVPFYNLHKVLAGLLDAHRYAPARIGDVALRVASGFGTWVETYATSLEDPTLILDTEYGGMNEALYRLHAITGDPVHRRAAERFDATELFRRLAAGDDVLAGRHANTTIPKLVGALKRYTVLAADDLNDVERAQLDMHRAAAENFWRIVVDDHTYANGANSQSEHFHAAGTLFERANNGAVTGYGENSTAEGCNEYNMLKLSRALFALTGEVRYADYDEVAFVNSILASQNPETGMVTYFQPQRAGYAKVFGEPYDQFWCDHGTGIESFTKLGDGIYAFAEDAVVVNQFRSSELRWLERNLRLTQVADVPRAESVRVRIDRLDEAGPSAQVMLRLRVPSWIADAPTLKVNGRLTPAEAENGYLAVAVSAGDEVEYTLPAAVRISDGTENENWVAFAYGPVLLATALSRENVDASYTAGVLVQMGVADPSLTGEVVVEDPADWKRSITENLVRLPDGPGATGASTMRFALRNTDETSAALIWEPYFSLHGVRYATYVTLVERGARGAESDAAATGSAVIDALTSFDNNNSEADKNHRFHRSSVGVRDGAQYREAAAGTDAFFEYDLIVDPTAASNRLGIRYSGQDAGRTFDVLLNGVLWRRETVEDPRGDGTLYERIDEVPRELLAAGGFKRDQHGGFALDADGHRIPTVTVRFQSAGTSPVGGVFGVWTERLLAR
ncbi:beta-L-arabinofuranosidase domain-containing protein [Microbacterium sp. NPDC056234]|uniref:beta-L-arabinofuranosidase domain-containing protein n=1 Tax=Microbacterium sp. NPDC056234 TaxID=3345757 RepID=UPI0035D77E33